MTDEKKKLCPFKLGHALVNGLGVAYCACMENTCAWWVNYEKGGGHCAVTALPFELRKISEKLEPIAEWARCQP